MKSIESRYSLRLRQSVDSVCKSCFRTISYQQDVDIRHTCDPEDLSRILASRQSHPAASALYANERLSLALRTRAPR